MKRLGILLLSAALLQGCVTYKTAWQPVGPKTSSSSLIPDAPVTVEKTTLSLSIQPYDGPQPRVTVQGRQRVRGPEQVTENFQGRRETHLWSPLLMLWAPVMIVDCPIIGLMDTEGKIATCGRPECVTAFYELAGFLPAASALGMVSANSWEEGCRPETSYVTQTKPSGETTTDTRALAGAWVNAHIVVEDSLGQAAQVRDEKVQLDAEGLASLPLDAQPQNGQVIVSVTLGSDPSARVERALDSKLFAAADNGDLAAVETLLAHGAAPDAVGPDGSTALIIAAVDHHPDIALTLLAHGADVGAADANGKTPLAMALQQGDRALASIFLANGDASRTAAPDPANARCAWAFQAADLPRLGAAREASLAQGARFDWDSAAASWSVPAECGGLPPFPLIAELASRALKSEFAQAAGAPAQAPAPLVQDKFESSAAFQARAEKARQALAARQEAYQRRADQARAAAEKSRPFWLARAFLGVFGAPRVAQVDYDPNSQLFAIDVKGSGILAGAQTFHLALVEPVTNKQAREVDAKLRRAAVRVRFSLAQGRFDIAEAEVTAGGRRYEALPAAAAGSAAPAVVDLGRLGAATPAEAPTVSVQYAQTPEIQAKLAELDALRAQKTKSAELAALEAQIAALKGEAGGAPSYNSDVDDPGFQRPTRPDDWALVVGIESYQNDLPKASFAERDAETARKYFQALGVPAQNIILLEGPRATKSALESYLEDYLPKNVTADSRVYFYYSGHGAPDPSTGSAYLVPWEADPKFINVQGLPVKDVYERLNGLKAKEVLVAMDSCFSGAGGRSVLAQGARPLVNVVDDSPVIGGRSTLLAAAHGDEITGGLDSQGHGLFTYYFLEGLRSGATDAKSLYDFLEPKVEAEARRQNREQDPVFQGADLKF